MSVHIAKGHVLPGASTLHPVSHGLPLPIVVGLVSIVVVCALSGLVAYIRRFRALSETPPRVPSRQSKALRRTRFSVAMVALIALAAGFGVGTTSVALASSDTAGPGWGTPSQIDPVTAQQFFVSCPTTGFCMAATTYGHTWTYNGSSWTAQSYVHSGGGGAVSCPTSSFCAMLNGGGEVQIWDGSNASNQRSGWGTPVELSQNTGSYLTAFLPAVSCPTTSFCVVAGVNGVWASGDPTGATSWRPVPDINPQDSAADWQDYISALSCSAANACVAVTEGGYALVDAGGPASSASSWVASQIDPTNALTGVSCISSSFCVAVNNDGAAYTYNGSSWTSETIDSGASLSAVACSTGSFCVGVATNGDMVLDSGGSWNVHAATSSNGFTTVACVPDAPSCTAVDNHGQTWTVSYSALGYLDGTSCAPDVSSCVAVGAEGQTASSSNGGATWAPKQTVTAPSTWSQPTTVSGSGQFAGVSCASASDCLAVGSTGNRPVAGDVSMSTDGGKTWSSLVTVSGTTSLTAISCSSTSDCVAVGSDSSSDGVVTYTTDGGSTWSSGVAVDSTAQLEAVSCSSTSDCVAVGSNSSGNGIAIYTTDGGVVWSVVAVGGMAGLTAISCPTTSECVAVGYDADGDGSAVTSADGGSTWSSPVLVSGRYALTAVSCSSSSDCVAVGNDGNGDGITATTTDGGSTWSSAEGLDNAPLAAISCPTTSDCVAVGGGGSGTISAMTVNGGQGWQAGAYFVNEPLASLTAISCPTTSLCVAVSSDSGVGAVIRTSHPFVYQGGGNGTALSAVSCPSSSDCVGVGFTGYRSIGGESFATTSTDGSTSWSAPVMIDGQGQVRITSISCSSTSDCVAVGADDTQFDGTQAGIASVSTDGGKTWSVPAVMGSVFQLDGVSCSSTSDCVAVGSNSSGDGVVTYTTDGGSTWSTPSVLSATWAFSAISCSSSSDCVAVGYDQAGYGIASTTADGGSTWSSPVEVVGSNDLDAVSCPTSSDCIAVGYDNANGVISATTDGGTSWSTPLVSANVEDPGFSAVSCASVSSCAAVGMGTYINAGGYDVPYGATTYSIDSFASSPSWSPAAEVPIDSTVTSALPLQSLYYPLFGVSCVTDTSSSQFCAIATGGGQLITGTLSGSTFTENGSPQLSGGGGVVTAVSCASPSFCVAVDSTGNAYTWDGSSWSAPDNLVPAPGVTFTAISCPTTSLCMAGDAAGDVWTDSAGSWSKTSLSSAPILSLSCPTSSWCMAITQVATSSGFSTDSYTYDGSSWSSGTAVPGDGIDGLSCPAAGSCVAVDGDGSALYYGASWSEAKGMAKQITPPFGNEGFHSVSCISDFCVAGGYYGGYGFATTTKNVTATDPTPWNGHVADVISGKADLLTSASCVNATTPTCLTVGTSGSVVAYVGPVPYLDASFSAASDGATATSATVPCSAIAPSTPPSAGSAEEVDNCLLDVTLPADATATTTAPISFTPNATWPSGGTLTCTWAVSPSASSGLSAGGPCPSSSDKTPTGSFDFPAGTYSISLAASSSGYSDASTNPVAPVTTYATVVVNRPPVSPCSASDVAGPDGSLVIMESGADQSAPTSTAFGSPLRLGLGCLPPGVTQLQDHSPSSPGAHPIIGATVTWTMPSTSATATFPGPTSSASATTGSSTSDPNLGVATSPTFTAGSSGGTFTVTATVTLPSAVSALDPAGSFSVTYDENITSTAPSCANTELVGFGSDQRTTVGSSFPSPLMLDVGCLTGSTPTPTSTFTSPSSGPTGTWDNSTTTSVPASDAVQVTHYKASFSRYNAGTWDGAFLPALAGRCTATENSPPPAPSAYKAFSATGTAPGIGQLPYVDESVADVLVCIPIL